MNSTPIRTFSTKETREKTNGQFSSMIATLVFIVESEQDHGERGWKQHGETSTADVPYYYVFDGACPVRDRADEYSGQLALNRYISVSRMTFERSSERVCTFPLCSRGCVGVLSFVRAPGTATYRQSDSRGSGELEGLFHRVDLPNNPHLRSKLPINRSIKIHQHLYHFVLILSRMEPT